MIAAALAFAGGEAAKTVVAEGVKDACRSCGPTVSSG